MHGHSPALSCPVFSRPHHYCPMTSTRSQARGSRGRPHICPISGVWLSVSSSPKLSPVTILFLTRLPVSPVPVKAKPLSQKLLGTRCTCPLSTFSTLADLSRQVTRTLEPCRSAVRPCGPVPPRPLRDQSACLLPCYFRLSPFPRELSATRPTPAADVTGQSLSTATTQS